MFVLTCLGECLLDSFLGLLIQVTWTPYICLALFSKVIDWPHGSHINIINNCFDKSSKTMHYNEIIFSKRENPILKSLWNYIYLDLKLCLILLIKQKA